MLLKQGTIEKVEGVRRYFDGFLIQKRTPPNLYPLKMYGFIKFPFSETTWEISLNKFFTEPSIIIDSHHLYFNQVKGKNIILDLKNGAVKDSEMNYENHFLCNRPLTHIYHR